MVQCRHCGPSTKKDLWAPLPKGPTKQSVIHNRLVFQCAQIDNPQRNPIRSKCTPLPPGPLARPRGAKCSSSSQLGAKVYLKEKPLSRLGPPNQNCARTQEVQPNVRLFQRSQAAPKPRAINGPPRIVARRAHRTCDLSTMMICTMQSMTTPLPMTAVVRSAANLAL